MKGTDPGALAFRYRGGVWTIFFLLVLSLSDPGGVDPLPGLFFVVLGQGIRFWAAGTITRYRGEEVVAGKLVTWGPYALARNPLYVGNAFIGTGWCMLSGSFYAFLLFIFVFIVLYVILVIPYEESFLKASFPGEFEQYSKKTGRFFPISMPAISDLAGPFQAAVLWKSERHSLWVTLAGTLVILSRRWW